MLSVFNLVYRLLICLTIRVACLHKSWNQKHISDYFLNVPCRFLLPTYLSLAPHTLPLSVDLFNPTYPQVILVLVSRKINNSICDICGNGAGQQNQLRSATQDISSTLQIRLPGAKPEP